MNLTTKQLKQIIIEELEKVLDENNGPKQKILNLLNSSEIKDIKQGLQFNKALKIVPIEEVGNIMLEKFILPNGVNNTDGGFWDKGGIAWGFLKHAPMHPKWNKLTVLNLSRYWYGSYPEEINNLKNLGSLTLRGCGLSAIPKSIGNLKNLRVLSLSDNDLVSLPEEIGSLKNLQRLSLNNNNLESLPKSIGNLKNLKKLMAMKNNLRIDDVPEHLRKITRI